MMFKLRLAVVFPKFETQIVLLVRGQYTCIIYFPKKKRVLKDSSELKEKHRQIKDTEHLCA